MREAAGKARRVAPGVLEPKFTEGESPPQEIAREACIRRELEA
jgi:hypothetical protein